MISRRKLITTDNYNDKKSSMKSDISKESDLEIYRTTEKDFDVLTDISRKCFPNQTRWQAPKSFGRKWWNLMVNSDFCEVWTCASEGKVIAYCAVIYDRLKYEQTWQNFRPGLGSKLYILAARPNIIIEKVVECLKKCFVKKDESSNINHAEQQEKMKKLLSQKVPWLGPVAVSPDMQCKGMATKICQIFFDRIAKSGYKEVWAYLRKNNFKSKGLTIKIGFEVVDEIEHLLFIKKTLNSDETQN